MTTLIHNLTNVPGQPLVHALGWTLLHFCWQGAVVALLLWCVLGLLPARLSRARYAAALCALGLMAALPLATFARLAADELNASRAFAGAPIAIDPVLLRVAPAQMQEPLLERMERVLDESAPWVPAIWLAGVVVFLGRLNFGLLLARRMQSAGALEVPDELRRALEGLRVRLGIARAVRLMHSAMVQAPTVIGWLRPVVLIPVGCLTGMSAAQIEAVLAHELAHVRRHDYLVSVMQSVVEALLFYQPAVWWVSRQVRRERENCCDDVAVKVAGDPLAYARALSSLEEHRASMPEIVLGANGGVLKMRIKRLLGYSEERAALQPFAITLLVVAVVAAGSYLVTTARAQPSSENAATHTSEVVPLEEDTSSSLSKIKLGAPATLAQMTGVSQPMGQGEAQAGEEALKPVYRNWLDEDVVWIITPEERAAFLRLTNVEERDKFIEDFWLRRNPTPGTAANSFREEHYARIAYANMYFKTDRPGWMTDRGHIYIAYGKPDEIDSHPSGGDSSYAFEVWHYGHIPGVGDNVDVKFVDSCNCGDYRYTIDRPVQPGTGPMSNLQQRQAALELASRILASGGATARPQSAALAAAAAAQGDGSIAGTIVDPSGAVVPGAMVMVVNTDTGVRGTAVTDDTGKYLVSGLRPGPYIVNVGAKGFQRMLQENVQVGAKQQVEVDLKLTVGGDNTTVTVTGAPVAAAPAPQPFKAPPEPVNRPVKVSSGVMAGSLISRPDPVYPEAARAAHVQGAVVLHAVIGKDGTIEDLQVIAGPAPLLVSAIDAVRQWKYKSYLLNGEPTEVETTIRVNYALEGSAEEQAQPGAPGNTSEAPRKIGGNVTAPVLIHHVEPEFTPEAKKAEVGGSVLVNFIVDEHGLPQNVRVQRGLGVEPDGTMDPKIPKAVADGMNQKAIDAVKQYKFNPAKENGKPVAVELNIEINFQLF